MDDSNNKIYFRKNGGDIYNDDQAIESCRNEQSRDIIDNARLGSYDEFGNYIIVPNIKQELLSMPKLIFNTQYKNDETIFETRGIIPIFGDMFFKLKITPKEVVLYIVETVRREANGYLEIYEEPIDALSCEHEQIPQEVIFRNYNIKQTSTESEKDFDVYQFDNILTRKVYLNLLSKELRRVSNLNEKQAFDKMVTILKEGGDYGKKVLHEFVERLKDRPAVFEIEKTEKYNKSINEILLSSLDVVTTEEDKQNPEVKKTYLAVLNVRNENIKEDIKKATVNIEEEFVYKVVESAKKEYKEDRNLQKNNFLVNTLHLKTTKKEETKTSEETKENIEKPKEEKQEEEKQTEVEKFLTQIKGEKPKKRVLEKPILKQKIQKQEETENKEEKIKQILEKKQEKPTVVKVVPAKSAPKQQTLKPKKSAKAKVKKKTSPVKKPSAGAKPKMTKLSAGPAKKKKKKDDDFQLLMVNNIYLNKQNPRQEPFVLEPTIQSPVYKITADLGNQSNVSDQEGAPIVNKGDEAPNGERINSPNQEAEQLKAEDVSIYSPQNINIMGREDASAENVPVESLNPAIHEDSFVAGTPNIEA